MDIKIKTDDLKFKFRVSAVFIHDGKLLVDKYRTEESYCLPGSTAGGTNSRMFPLYFHYFYYFQLYLHFDF